jgi:hypothetical protein
LSVKIKYKKSLILIKIFIDVYFCGGFSNYKVISKLNIKTLEVLKVWKKLINNKV